jgi:hypothetical protein
LDSSTVFFNVAAGGVTDTQLDVVGIATSPPGQQQRFLHQAYLNYGDPSAWAPSQSWEFVGSDNSFEGRMVVVESGSPLDRVDVFVGLSHNYKPMFQGNWLPQWESLPTIGMGEGIACVLAADGVYSPDTTALQVAVIDDTDTMLHIVSDGNGWPASGWEALGKGVNGFLIPNQGQTTSE